MAFIYAFKFPNNKYYVGYTSKNYKLRWSTHKYFAYKQKLNTKLYNAIRKYNWDNIEKFILEENPNNDYTLKILEQKYIDQYDSIENGYNTLLGGKYFPIMYGKDNPSYKRKNKKMSEYFSKEQCELHKINVSNAVSGSKNKHAKKFKILSPQNEEFYIHGGLVNFCKEKNISFTQLYKAVNDNYNIVPNISNKANYIRNYEQRKNSIGWSIFYCN